MVSLLIAVVVAAVVFDYINGFHDAANAIATVVSTGVLPLRTAVIVAHDTGWAESVAGGHLRTAHLSLPTERVLR